MYLSNNTRPNIAFVVSLFARFSSSPTKRHWNGVKDIFRYLRGTIDMRFFYSYEFNSQMIGYADAVMLSFFENKDSNDTVILYEDNTACIAQLKGGYIKGDRTKHISPKFFFTHDLQQNGEIDVQQACSSDNLVDMFTKVLPTSTFVKLRYKIGMHRLRDIK
ncbi:secreted RxLR effector protein 161-like [Lycium barbarum]|uniref:secreted RxLR effector protein 161-like n=1 Tax=Lycium barbarum TaxID=112863 RepID=UPI00293E031B|nr:secreted RxLR effector protein 161-like [Lycium barbarum]